MGDQGMAYVPGPDDAAVIGAGAAPIILVTGGWLVVGNKIANAEHALVGLALLLLGVFVIMLSTVANQFAGAARLGAAVADAVLDYFFALGNN
ncbi:hypothetical protein BAE44_0007780 [Dichanthelium oligosanthes]|uniref:Uncharacterized protein n=1 Tax=Dichanthelium oligosanthes TaxID=888268 RepID=A0A1E5W1E1_9POAL|nr:hypothetical protein BAE44_0007780 [Dichanthelium oligosanthes]